jgi:hypothetical protein
MNISVDVGVKEGMGDQTEQKDHREDLSACAKKIRLFSIGTCGRFHGCLRYRLCRWQHGWLWLDLLDLLSTWPKRGEENVCGPPIEEKKR